MANNTNDNDYSSSYSPELIDQLIAALPNDSKTLDIFPQLVDKACEEIEMKIANIKKRTAQYPHSRPVIDYLLEKLSKFISERDYSSHFDPKLIPYQLELTRRLDRIDWNNHDIVAFTPIDEALIYMDYNSKTYIKMLEGWLEKRIEEEADPMARLLKKQFYQKAFLQLHRKPDTILHPEYLSLTETIDNWFVHEAHYLDNMLELFIKAKDTKLESIFIANATKKEHRVRLSLTADQIALFLRAADETRVLLSKSMNAVYQNIIPHVSSQNRDVLSPSAVRTSSYNAEQSDKDVLIKALQNIIKRIEGY